MDPIHPITPGPAPIPRGSLPVERLEKITRERDRRNRDPLARDGRRQPPRRPPPPPDRPDEDGDGPRIDVRV